MNGFTKPVQLVWIYWILVNADQAREMGYLMGKWRPMMVDSVLGMNGFIAWYYLQHIRGYRPLLTTVENDYAFTIPLQ